MKINRDLKYLNVITHLKNRLLLRSMICGIALVLVSFNSAHAFQWSGVLQGEEGVTLSGLANFNIDNTNNILTLELTNTTDGLSTSGQVLTGLTWDITNLDITLTMGTAELSTGSSLVGFDSGNFQGVTDLSAEWGFKDNISAGTLGSYGVSSVGDILLGADTFGIGDRFDTFNNLFGPDNPNGLDGAIVGINTDFSSSGLQNHGPLVESKMIFSWDFTTTGTVLSLSDFTNINPFFGTDGEVLGSSPTPKPVPEPATMALLGIGLAGLGGRYLKRRRKQLVV